MANQANPDKPNSGYGRLRLRHKHLIGLHERLQADHEVLRHDHEKLEAAFSELLKLHNSLLDDLKTRQHPLPSFLMRRAHV